jgi:hypothetical protein
MLENQLLKPEEKREEKAEEASTQYARVGVMRACASVPPPAARGTGTAGAGVSVAAAHGQMLDA